MIMYYDDKMTSKITWGYFFKILIFGAGGRRPRKTKTPKSLRGTALLIESFNTL